ncbi:MAG: hypothetical protein ABL996_08070 [Micropepsaceae bacterium]
MIKLQKVSSSDFAGKFGHWSFAAQSAPVMVTDRKTGVVKGYFVSAQIFSEFLHLREQAPKAGFVWDMSSDMAAELEKPLPRNYPKRGLAKNKKK